MREFDPARWEGVPITFKTQFTDDLGKILKKFKIEKFNYFLPVALLAAILILF